MSKINYHEARKTLSDVCEGYLAHNQTQMDVLKRTSRTIPAEHFFGRACSGFPGWMSCKYAEIMDDIVWLNCSGYRQQLDYYEYKYPPCESKTKFSYQSIEQETADFDPYDVYPDVDPRVVLDRLTILVGLFDYVMIEENRELDFKKTLKRTNLKMLVTFCVREASLFQ